MQREALSALEANNGLGLCGFRVFEFDGFLAFFWLALRTSTFWVSIWTIIRLGSLVNKGSDGCGVLAFNLGP